MFKRARHPFGLVGETKEETRSPRFGFGVTTRMSLAVKERSRRSSSEM